MTIAAPKTSRFPTAFATFCARTGLDRRDRRNSRGRQNGDPIIRSPFIRPGLTLNSFLLSKMASLLDINWVANIKAIKQELLGCARNREELRSHWSKHFLCAPRYQVVKSHAPPMRSPYGNSRGSALRTTYCPAHPAPRYPARRRHFGTVICHQAP